MAIFGPKPRVNLSVNPNPNPNLSSLERRFFVLEYGKTDFPGLYCLKKESWKNGHYWTKTMG